MNFQPPGNFISTGLAFLAFVVVFYVLLARERKTPYIINFIFAPAGMLLAGILSAFFLQLIPVASPSPVAIWATRVLTLLVIIFFTAGLILTLSNIWRLHNRQVHFRDDNRIRNTQLYRWFKRKLRQSSDRPSYAHQTVPLDTKQIRDILAATMNVSVIHNEISPRTVAICNKPLLETDSQLVTICTNLLQADWYVQYTTCIRHPSEFNDQLVRSLGVKWNELKNRIVAVDAFTPHFGFTDSVHEDKTVQLKKTGINYVVARESYAGVHTAAARAFNKLKNLDKTTRRATIVIYEGSNALADLESKEQYRIFARHVLSSERMWGGMVTFFVEPAIGPPEMDLLRTYADLFVSSAEVNSGQLI